MFPSIPANHHILDRSAPTHPPKPILHLMDVAKKIRHLKTEDMMLAALTTDEEKLTGLVKDAWMDNYRDQKQREALCIDGRKHAYAIIVKLCTPRMVTRLEGTSSFSKAGDDEDTVALVTLIKGVCCRFNDQQQPIWSVIQAKKMVFLIVQSK